MHSLRWDSPLTQTGLCALCDPGRSAQICSSGHQRDPALADICGSPCGSWGFSWESLGCPTSLLPTEVFLQPSALLKQHQVVEGVVSGNRRIYGSELRGDFIGIQNGYINVHSVCTYEWSLRVKVHRALVSGFMLSALYHHHHHHLPPSQLTCTEHLIPSSLTSKCSACNISSSSHNQEREVLFQFYL